MTDRDWTVLETVEKEIVDTDRFSFKLPGTEVKSSRSDFLFQTVFDYCTAKYDCFRQKFLEALAKRNSEQIAVLFADIFSEVSYYHNTPEKHFYQALINASLRAMGI
ncbi:MAG: hypothetical protein LBP22_13350 [Deltaproteobacteria bacterium]|nr:hypothetical protein [Deltaproteobacteria bacterium]